MSFSAKIGEAFVEVKVNTGSINKAMRSVRGKMKAMGQRMRSAGVGLTAGITAPLGALSAAVGKIGGDFEDALTESQAIMGDLSDQLKNEMSNAAREVARTTDKSAKDAAESFFFLASAGLDAKESIEALPRVAEFATAGQFDMATATDLLTDAQSALGLTSEDTAKNMENMNRVADSLVKANQLANASVEQFSESLTNKAGARLKQLQKPLSEGVALLAAFADQGVKGRKAGERLNIVLRDLPRVASENSDAFDELGIQVFDSQGKMRNMADIIADFENALSGMSDKQKTAAFEQLGLNQRVADGISMLAGSSQDIATYEKSLKSAGGATAEVAQNQMQSFQKQLGLIIDELKDVAISLFQAFVPVLQSDVLPAVRSGIEVIGNWAKALSDATPTTRKWVLIIGGIAAAIGPALIAIGSLVSLVSGGLTAALVAVTNPISLVVGAIAGVGSGVLWAFGEWDQVVKAMNKLLEGDFIGALQAITQAFANVNRKIVGFAQDIFQGVRKWMVDKFNIVLNRLKGWAGSVSDVFSKLSFGLVGGSIVPDMVLAIGDWFGRMGTIMIDETEKSTGRISEAFENAKFSINRTLGDMLEGTKGVMEGMADIVGTVMDEIQRELIIRPATNALTGSVIPALAGGLAGIFGFGGGGGAVTQSTGAVEQVLGQGPGLVAAQSGAFLRPGQLALVGESGPELFRSPRGGEVLPPGKVGGGGNVEVNVINKSNNNVKQNKRKQGGRSIIDVVIEEVAGDISNFGPVGQAIEQRFPVGGPQTKKI